MFYLTNLWIICFLYACYLLILHLLFPTQPLLHDVFGLCIVGYLLFGLGQFFRFGSIVSWYQGIVEYHF